MRAEQLVGEPNQWEHLLLLPLGTEEPFLLQERRLGLGVAIAVLVGHLDIADPVAYQEPRKRCRFFLMASAVYLSEYVIPC